MVCGETALAFLNRNRLLYLDMLEPIRRGTAELLYTGADGVLLYDRLAEAHMLGADTPQALERMLPLMEGCTILTGHQLWYKDRLAARFGLTCEQICYQAAWLEETSPAPLPFGGALRLLDRSWAPWVYDHYSHAFGGVAYMEGAIDRGMLGAFVDGKPAGFAGFHIEGAIGRLEGRPPYRRRGIGEALLRGVVSLALSRGQYAYGQVFTDNAPSLALQRKAGMAVSQEILFWLF